MSVEVVLWKQKAKPERESSAQQYDYLRSVVIQAPAGSEIELSGRNYRIAGAQPASPLYTLPTDDKDSGADKLRYFEFDHADGQDAPVVVSGSGTVINVYYDRIRFTLQFRVYTGDRNVGSYTMTHGGTTYTKTNPYSLTAELGESLEETWPYNGSPKFTFTNTNNSQEFYGWTNYDDVPQVSKVGTMTEKACDHARNGRVMTGDWSNVEGYYLFYMFDALKDDSPTHTRNSVEYRHSDQYTQLSYADRWFGNKTIQGLSHTDDHIISWPSYFNDDQKKAIIDANPDIKASGNNYRVEMLFYIRNKHTIQVNLNDAEAINNQIIRASWNDRSVSYGSSYNSQLKFSNVKYGEKLSYFKPLTDPTREGCVFGGWYADAEGKTPFNFGATMPDADTIIYAKWIVNPVDVLFYLDADEQDLHDSRLNLSWGSTVTGVVNPGNLSQYGQFLGWYYRPFPSVPTLEAPFTQGTTPATSNPTKVYARWKTSGFIVNYQPGNGLGNRLDAQTYALNQPVRLPGIEEGFTGNPTDKTKVFIGWREKGKTNAPTYHPGDYYNVYYNVVFEGVWADKSQVVTVIYHKNDPIDSEDATISVSYLLNSVVTVQGTHWAVDGYAFDGWDTQADGNGTDYTVGGKFVAKAASASGVFVDGEFHLYAQWKKQEETITIVKHWIDNGNAYSTRPGTLAITVNGVAVNVSPVVDAGANTWTYTATVKKANQYHVVETVPAGYEWIDAVGGVAKKTADKKYEITNTLSPGTAEIIAQKVWQDADGGEVTDANKLPGSVTLQIKDGAGNVVASGSATNNSNWQFKGNLPVYDQNGVKIVYTADEANVPGGYGKTLSGLTVTNTFGDETVDVEGTKTWNVPAGTTEYPVVTVRLYQDGTEIKNTTITGGGTSYSFTGLPKYKTDGTEHEYTVSEDDIAGYTKGQDGYALTNTLNEYPFRIEYYYNNTFGSDSDNIQVPYGTAITTGANGAVTIGQTEYPGRPNGYIYTGTTMPSWWDNWAGVDQEINIIRVDYVSPPAPTTYTVTYQPGEHGTFAAQSYPGLGLGAATPGFSGTAAGEDGWLFTGWLPSVQQYVTGDANYVAQWVPEEPQPGQYELSVLYWYDEISGRTAAPTYRANLAEGAAYNVASPRIKGWTPDLSKVFGVMPKGDVRADVVYDQNEYTLTINYVYTTGGQAAPTYRRTAMNAGDRFAVTSPVIDGYTASDATISGTMPAYNLTVTVYYAPTGTPEEPEIPLVDLMEYGVPLGVGAVVANVGECFE
ncbi:MAG: Cna B-type domain-containing protein [Eubacteriales bacterium]|nr:Cna B-type domain-containing protein [Eubacteriales bacterium]